MARKGRQFELLVTRIQRVLSPIGSEVISPDYVVDSVTGQRREIDAAIRFDDNGKRLLINVECRDRSSRQDVTWIEQLATKRRDIGAIRTIAVSRTPFSDQAETKAQKNQIDTFVISAISDEEIKSWIRSFPLVVWEDLWEFKEVEVALFDVSEVDLEELRPAFQGIAPSSVSVTDRLTGEAKDLQQVVRMWQMSHRGTEKDIYSQINEVGKVYESVVDYTMQRGQVSLNIMGKDYNVNRLRIVVGVWRRESHVPRTRSHSYAAPAHDVLQTVEYDIPQLGPHAVLSLHRDIASRKTNVAMSWDPPSSKNDAHGQRKL